MSDSDNVLEQGVQNEDVLDVQDRLTFIQLYNGPIDGSYTTSVEEAVRAYQQHVSGHVSGTLDADGLRHLREYTDHHGYGRRHHDQTHGHGHGHHQEHMSAEQWQIEQAKLYGGAESVEFDAGEEQPVVAHTDKREFHDHLAGILHNVSTRALTHATANDVAVIAACQAFKIQYVMPKIHEIEGRVSYEDLGKQITRSLMDLVGIRVCREIAGPVTKWFAEQISTGCARKMSANTKNMLAADGHSKALTHAFEEMMTRAELATTVFHDTVSEVLTETLDPIYAALDAHQQLAADQEWASQFYDMTDGQLDEAIEHVFGIPGPAQRKEMEVAIYQQLVEGFDALAIRQSESSRIFPDRRNAYEEYQWNPDGRAHEDAKQAAEHFRDEIQN